MVEHQLKIQGTTDHKQQGLETFETNLHMCFVLSKSSSRVAGMIRQIGDFLVLHM